MTRLKTIKSVAAKLLLIRRWKPSQKVGNRITVTETPEGELPSNRVTLIGHAVIPNEVFGAMNAKEAAQCGRANEQSYTCDDPSPCALL